MLKDIFNSFCCAIVLCCGVNMVENVNGMVKFVTSEDQTSSPSILPITSDFPYFLNSRISSNPAEWPRALDNISQVVSHLILNKDHEDLSVAYEAIRKVSDYSFEEFARFCASEYCDAACRDFIANFFTLTLAALKGLPQVEITAEITRDFSEFVSNIVAKQDHILTSKDSVLFKKIAFILNEFE
jgi:hypothetical protein